MKYLILGNGAAGIEAALTIRKHDQTSPIVVLTESHYLHYFRPKLVDFLSHDRREEDLVVYNDEFYRQNSIENLLGRRVVAVRPASKTVLDDRGEIHSYDRLLIATGSKPVLPQILGIDKSGVFTLRSLTDARNIKAVRSKLSKIVVIGGGLLGLENANALMEMGVAVQVVEGAEWLLPRQLDREGGQYLQKLLEDKGLVFHLASHVEAILGEGCVNAVQFRNGAVLACDAVLVSAGVHSDFEFLKGSEIETDRGIVVNDYFETNIEGIWAAGDIAQHRGTCYGLWTVAKEQGGIAGANMTGEKKLYEGSLPATLLKITGIDVFSIGNRGSETDGILKSSGLNGHKKLHLEKGRPVGAQIIGDKLAIRTARKILSGQAQPEEFVKHLG